MCTARGPTPSKMYFKLQVRYLQMMKTCCSMPPSLNMRAATDSLVTTAGMTGSPTRTATLNGTHGTLALHTQSTINGKTMAANGAATHPSPQLKTWTTLPLMDHACHEPRQRLCGSRKQLARKKTGS